MSITDQLIGITVLSRRKLRSIWLRIKSQKDRNRYLEVKAKGESFANWRDECFGEIKKTRNLDQCFKELIKNNQVLLVRSISN